MTIFLFVETQNLEHGMKLSVRKRCEMCEKYRERFIFQINTGTSVNVPFIKTLITYTYTTIVNIYVDMNIVLQVIRILHCTLIIRNTD